MKGKVTVSLFNDKTYDAMLMTGYNPELYNIRTAGELLIAQNESDKYIISFMTMEDANTFINENDNLKDSELIKSSDLDEDNYNYMVIVFENTKIELNNLIEKMIEVAKEHYHYDEDGDPNLFKLTMDQISSYNILKDDTIADNLVALIYGYTNIFESLITTISSTEDEELMNKVSEMLNSYGIL